MPKANATTTPREPRGRLKGEKASKPLRRGRCVKLPVSLKEVPSEHFAMWGDQSFRVAYKSSLSSQLSAAHAGMELQHDFMHTPIAFHPAIARQRALYYDEAPRSPPPQVKEEADEYEIPLFRVEVREPTPELTVSSSRSVSPDNPTATSYSLSFSHSHSPPSSPPLTPPDSPPLTPPDSPPQRSRSSPAEIAQLEHLHTPATWVRRVLSPSSTHRRSRSDPCDDSPHLTPQSKHSGNGSLFAAVSKRQLLPIQVKQELDVSSTTVQFPPRIADVDVDPSEDLDRRNVRFEPYRRPVPGLPTTVLPSFSQFIAECHRASEEALPSWYKKIKQIPESSDRQTSQPALYSD
ncbi:hypothetical protein C8Q74DRAFT_1215271 [Fomes fomentarius]|nr:hypothetical protein C8Q74DRAFT_1215271 [Fomes fomentarius]